MRISRTVREDLIEAKVFLGHASYWVTSLILPGFGIISHVIVSAAKKPIFGYLGMVYGAPVPLFIRYV